MPGLVVDARVPMPDDFEVTASYSHLLELERDEEEFHRPEKAKNRYRVIDLLNGVSTAEEREAARRRSEAEPPKPIPDPEPKKDEKPKPKRWSAEWIKEQLTTTQGIIVGITAILAAIGTMIAGLRSLFTP